MKYINKIVSHRGLKGDASWLIVYEWEDIIASSLNVIIQKSNPLIHYMNNILNRFHLGLLQNIFCNKNKLELRFITISGPICPSYIRKNTIPIIIDFWLRDDELTEFIESYNHIPLLLVTNKEVELKLKRIKTQFRVEHFPLSIPDQYAFKEEYLENKEYELCLFGRPNSFFLRLLSQYSKKHPDFRYITNNNDISDRQYYDNAGLLIAKDSGRESYFSMMKKTKISCYSTPGLDESKIGANNYNQITPRLLEMLCCGCMVIGHYPDSPDVNWYDIKDIVPNVNDYDHFEVCLDRMRKKQANGKTINAFLSRHYTSTRAEMLISILRKNGIQVL